MGLVLPTIDAYHVQHLPIVKAYADKIGLVEAKPSKENKPTAGHFKKAGVPPTRVRREVKVQAGAETPKAGDQVGVSIFADGERVDVIGTSRGKGFQGVVKRHHFGGGRATHGSMFHRAPGSIGASSFPSRVFPGTRMPGHMGTVTKTVRNLRIVGIDLDENLLMVEGAVPGHKDGYVMISKAKKPPRERRGFAGSGTVDPLKAAKKAAQAAKKSK